jgi:hypothetical protein
MNPANPGFPSDWTYFCSSLVSPGEQARTQNRAARQKIPSDRTRRFVMTDPWHNKKLGSQEVTKLGISDIRVFLTTQRLKPAAH